MVKENKIQIRCTEKEKNLWLLKAAIYANGNLSKYIRYCIENAPAKYLCRGTKEKK